MTLPRTYHDVEIEAPRWDTKCKDDWPTCLMIVVIMFLAALATYAIFMLSQGR